MKQTRALECKGALRTWAVVKEREQEVLNDPVAASTGSTSERLKAGTGTGAAHSNHNPLYIVTSSSLKDARKQAALQNRSRWSSHSITQRDLRALPPRCKIDASGPHPKPIITSVPSLDARIVAYAFEQLQISWWRGAGRDGRRTRSRPLVSDTCGPLAAVGSGDSARTFGLGPSPCESPLAATTSKRISRIPH